MEYQILFEMRFQYVQSDATVSQPFCDGMILIIAYFTGNRQAITKVPAGMLRGLPQIYIVASLKTQ